MKIDKLTKKMNSSRGKGRYNRVNVKWRSAYNDFLQDKYTEAEKSIVRFDKNGNKITEA